MGTAHSPVARRCWSACGAMLAAALLLTAAAPAGAGQDPGIRLGVYDGADSDEPVPVLGVYGRLDVPGPLNLELSADYRQESLLDGDLEATVVPVRASVLLNFFPGVSPYLLAGVGADYVSFEFRDGQAAAGDLTSLVFELHAGAGVELGLGPVTLIGDVRYCSVEQTSSDAVRQALGHDYDASGWYASLSAGISF